MTPGEDAIETPYGDLWYVEGLHGELVPMYFSEAEEMAALAAFLVGDYGSLTTVEIDFMKEALNEYSKPYEQ